MLSAATCLQTRAQRSDILQVMAPITEISMIEGSHCHHCCHVAIDVFQTMLCTMPSSGAADRRRAESLKIEANKLFRLGKYKAAIDIYTEAITFAPDSCVLYVNRALCRRKLDDWTGCEHDGRKALELQPRNMKVRCATQGTSLPV